MSTRTVLCSILMASALATSPSRADDWATISTGPGATHPDRATNDGFGGVYFSWIDVSATNTSSVRLTRITDLGVPAPGWPVNGRIPTATDERRGYSWLIADGTGGVFIAWQRLGPQSGTTYDVYLQRLTGDGQIASGWPSQGVLVAPVNGKSSSLTMTSDGTGGVFLTWFTLIGTDRRVYAQRMDADGAVHAGWTASGVPVCSASGTQVTPKSCPDGQGGLFVAWTDHRGASYDIYAQHLMADGTRASGWPETGVAVCTAPGDQVGNIVNGWIVSDGAGGFLCAYRDVRAGNLDIYAQRMTGSGSVAAGWPVDGVAITTAAGDQDDPLVETDDAGGAFITWTDYSKDSDPTVTDKTDVYAHHLLSNGTLAGGWPANGFALSDTTMSQDQSRVVRDGLGGAYFVWHDSWKGVAATHLDPSGVVYPGWAPHNGSNIGVHNAWRAPWPVLHPSGDLIVGFEDSDDHYAARIGSGGFGAVLSVDPGAMAPSRLLVAPHPMLDRANFSLTLRGGLPATLELFSIDGRRVWKREVGSLGAGPHTVAFAASASLPAGVYQLRLTEGSTSVTRSVVRIR